MSEERQLTYEQMAAAFWLVANDLCFVWEAESSGPFIATESTRLGSVASVRYEVGPNLNDTFYYACADTERIPWDEVIPLAEACYGLPNNEDRCWYLVAWAAKRRGEEPQIPKVKEKLDEFRARYPNLFNEDEYCAWADDE